MQLERHTKKKKLPHGSVMTQKHALLSGIKKRATLMMYGGYKDTLRALGSI